MASAGIEGTIRGHGADVLVLGDLAQQVRHDRAAAFPARGELDGPDIRGGGVHCQMHLAPLATTLNTMLAGLPFAVAKKLDAGTVHQQIQRPVGTTIGNLHLEGLLPAAQRRVVWSGPVQPWQTQEARDHPGCLPEWQLKQNLDRQAELDRRIREDWRAPGTALTRRVQSHLLV